jgi:hypothetical protein
MSQQRYSRRQLLEVGGATLAASILPLGRVRGADAGAASKRILFFTKSSGFQHPVITRKGDELSHAEKVLVDLGKEHGLEVIASKDGRLFDSDLDPSTDLFSTRQAT